VTALVIGFMLSGVMADHKEGEKLPADIACGSQGIEDCIQADAGHLSETRVDARNGANTPLRNF
jgi:hypothetical protein